ncbi:MAG: 4-hydroxy-tetrahydrodipicolinate reductase [Planctomycetes bacterium]|nr:4-hydroxy-tetrahydrodipicolinate reductase [Planctomycetota bacterium]
MTDRPIRLAVNGAAGRMGQRVIALAREDDAFELACAMEIEGHPIIGTTIAGTRYTDTLARDVDVVVDFSLPGGTRRALASAINTGAAMVIGTTGLPADVATAIDEASTSIAIVQTPNFSVGVNVLLRLLAEAAATLGEGYDVEIVETHHRFKKDAPSGTALAMADAVCRARGVEGGDVLRHGRQGQAERTGGEIGMHALRIGDTVGEHAVHFGTLGETVTLGHSAHSRDTFVLGALRAAKWVAGKAPGKYDMRDVLFGGK